RSRPPRDGSGGWGVSVGRRYTVSSMSRQLPEWSTTSGWSKPTSDGRCSTESFLACFCHTELQHGRSRKRAGARLFRQLGPCAPPSSSYLGLQMSLIFYVPSTTPTETRG